MPLLRPAAAPPVSLQLAKNLARTLRRGHPWVFADALRELPPAPVGSPALLLDLRGAELARGIYDAQNTLAFRVCSIVPGVALDEGWARRRLEKALAIRQSLLGWETTGFRLFNGEGDGVPGLVCDVYAGTAVLRMDGLGPEAFWDTAGVADWVAGALGVTTVWERKRRGSGGESHVLIGTPPEAPVAFTENGVRFTADVVQGQKTGFFLDQRENRERVRSLAMGRRVLNLFGYTGGFSIYAGLGGAAQVTTVDVSKAAIEAAGLHWKMNGLPRAGHEGVEADAFEFLEQAVREGRTWELVVSDPPSFAPNKESVPAARRGYRRLLTACANVTAPDGLLCACSCSSHVDLPMFLDLCEQAAENVGRRAAILEMRGQPFDHPTPLAMPEFRYLKFVLLRIE
ncbi:MAG: class I SAM-dependent rRNA methyltransferase [Candidatus Lambdaproteobacteria bacterium]|nr:class I SAM-dependent rRNA methyltransferase [Candidatus Lambdaproteobacteria bacterium]